MKYKYYQISFVLLLISNFLYSNNCYAQIKTNQEIIKELVMNEIFNSIEMLSDKPDSIQIILRGQSDIEKWVVEKLRTEVLERDITLLENNQDSVFQIIIEKIETQITYRGKNRSILLSYSNYEREIRAIISFFLKNERNTVLFNFSEELKNIDLITRNSIEKVENRLLPFTVGSKAESKFIKRFFEPIIVTAVTISAVYLFFSLRSS